MSGAENNRTQINGSKFTQQLGIAAGMAALLAILIFCYRSIEHKLAVKQTINTMADILQRNTGLSKEDSFAVESIESDSYWRGHYENDEILKLSKIFFSHLPSDNAPQSQGACFSVASAFRNQPGNPSGFQIAEVNKVVDFCLNVPESKDYHNLLVQQGLELSGRWRLINNRARIKSLVNSQDKHVADDAKLALADLDKPQTTPP